MQGILQFEIGYAYNQFIVCDRAVEAPGRLWLDAHIRQGFARIDEALSVSTLDSYGVAQVRVLPPPVELTSNVWERAYIFPFRCTSGSVFIGGVEDEDEETMSLEPGDYRLLVGLRLVAEEEHEIDLCFEPVSCLSPSTEIVAWGNDVLPEFLLEVAAVAV